MAIISSTQYEGGAHERSHQSFNLSFMRIWAWKHHVNVNIVTKVKVFTILLEAGCADSLAMRNTI